VTVLSDRDLRAELAAGTIAVTPLGPRAIQPASIDVRLGDTLRLIDPWTEIDPGAGQWGRTYEWPIPDEGYRLGPGAFVLGATMEAVTVPPDLLCLAVGRSSIARTGLTVEMAGLVDPGWSNGVITLEIANVGPAGIWLRPGMPIGQLTFTRLTTPAQRPYGTPELGSRYQGQTGPTGARAHDEETVR
jgi:dCTP deaminase